MEFCEVCGGMMLPSTDKGKTVLVCNACGKIKPLKNEVVDSYKFHEEISHLEGEEFKNLKEMEDWERKKIYKKFKEKHNRNME